MESIRYVGMDVHKETFDLVIYNPETGEYGKAIHIKASSKNVIKTLRKYKKDNELEDVKFITGYESGCLGYTLQRKLAAKGIECIILATSTMNISAKNKKTKNDKMDALTIAENLSSHSYNAVYIPAEDDEGTAEYLRMVDDMKRERTRLKQQINALVLRHGKHFDGRSKWTMKYMKWLDELELTPMAREALNEYIAAYRNMDDRIKRLEARIEELSHEEKYEEKISELKCFLGIDTLSAMAIHCNIYDFKRFPNAKAFASYVGLRPGEHSSSDKGGNTGITKLGSKHVRTTLIESSQALVRGNIYKKSKALKARQRGQKAEVIEYADKGSERLKKKFNRMMYRGKNRNVAIAAVARELACFIWGMETGNITNY